MDNNINAFDSIFGNVLFLDIITCKISWKGSHSWIWRWKQMCNKWPILWPYDFEASSYVHRNRAILVLNQTSFSKTLYPWAPWLRKILNRFNLWVYFLEGFVLRIGKKIWNSRKKLKIRSESVQTFGGIDYLHECL